MTLTFVPELDDELVAVAASQTHEIWSGGWALEAHIERQRANLRRAGPDIMRYVGLLDETGLIASMKRYGLVVHVPGHGPMPALGIGAVFTRKDARRKGAAGILLQWLMDDARARGCALAFLYSEIGTAYYEKFGFVALPSFEHAAKTADFPAETGLAIRAAVDDDEPKMIDLHEASWDPSIVRIVRTPELLRYFRFRNTPNQAWILQQGNVDVGYVIATIHDGSRDDGVKPSERTLWIDEWAAPNVATKDVLGALRAVAEAQSAVRVAGWLSPWHETPPFVATPRHEPIVMACPLHKTLPAINPAQTFFGSLDHF